MNYQIRYTKIESSPALEQYIETKIVNALKKLGEDPGDSWQITIEVGKETEHHAKGNIWFAEVNGGTSYGPLRVRAEGAGIHEAIDLAEEELKVRLSRSKGRIFSKGLRAARRMKNYVRFSRFARFFRRGRAREEGL